MAELNPTIALSGRPIEIPQLDIAKTFLTLGQLKFLAANARQVEATAAGTEATNLARQRLRDLNTPQPLRPAGDLQQPRVVAAPGLPQPGTTSSTPAIVTGPTVDDAMQAEGTAAPAPSTSSAAQAPVPGLTGPQYALARARAYLEADPIEGIPVAKAYLDHFSTHLDQQRATVENAASRVAFAAARFGSAKNEQLWQGALADMQQFGPIDHLPQHYSPENATTMLDMFRDANTRIAQSNKQIEQEQTKFANETARLLAQTEEAKLNIPITLGTGYAQRPGARPYTTVGPQAPLTGAPHSPLGVAQANVLSGEFTAGTQEFQGAVAAYNMVMAQKDAHTNAADKVLIKAFEKIAEPGQALQQAFANDVAGLGNLREQIGSAYNKLLTDKEGVLERGLRNKIVDAVQRSHAIQIDQHLQFRDIMRKKATTYGVDALEVAPNRLSVYGTGKHRWTTAQFQELMHRPEMAGQSQGKVLLGLANEGIHVEGGP